LLSVRFGLSLVASNIISTTCAMAFSFVANKKLVFSKHDGSVMKQALVFYGVTAFGLYVLQTGTIHLLTQIWTYPMLVLVDWAHIFGFHGHDPFLVKNGAKLIATGISLSWNYVMYKKVVFR
jgi:putative flippase GtrA